MTTLLFLLTLFAGEDDATVTAALDKFKTDFKSREASVRASAVQELSRTQHEKVWIRLAQLLGMDEKEVRIAAAKGLAGAVENKKRPVAFLIAGASANAKEPLVLAAILESIGKLKDASGAFEVERHFKSKQIPVGKAAIEAAAAIGSRSSAQPLIETLRWLEQGAQEAPTGQNNNNTPGTGGGGMTDESARERERALRPAVLKALEAITKANRGNAKEWEDWWRAEGGRFLSGR